MRKKPCRNARRNPDGTFGKNINRWEISDGVLKCYLGDEFLFFTDIENRELFKDATISKIANGYCAVRTPTEYMLLHRFLSRPKENEVVDHIKRNKKDNRLCNLRNTNKSVNSFNCGLRGNNTSGVTGVWYRNDTKRWAAEIKKDGRKHALGCYGTLEEAVMARREAEAVLYAD